ncbi:hypothetical protein DDJ31_33170 [Streptomyces griseoviridis]|uniref:Uncharacterized protein n=1 Tax=Streptomyces griseoviridis TaxID=45398 RepID=A0ABX5U2S0_STRGD|nr:hypothetical protein DDJ31_33170 [Streptomyces griseoviridis]
MFIMDLLFRGAFLCGGELLPTFLIHGSWNPSRDAGFRANQLAFVGPQFTRAPSSHRTVEVPPGVARLPCWAVADREATDAMESTSRRLDGVDASRIRAVPLPSGRRLLA